MAVNRVIGVSRLLLVLAFALFWGGLTFYTGIVVRVAHDVLSDPMDGGLITQRVTVFLQWLGLATALLMLLNALLVRKAARWYGNCLFGCAAILVCSLIGLFIVHGHLDSVIDVAAHEVTDRDAFDTGHRRYNQLTTVEWLSSLAYLVVTIPAWRRVDAADGKPVA